MNETDSLQALRRANPRHKPGRVETVDQLTRKARALLQVEEASDSPSRLSRPSLRRWRAMGIPATAILVAAVVTLLVVGSPVGPLAASPAEAMQQAVNTTAQAAESSGRVEIQITKDGVLWAGRTLRWNGKDLSISSDEPSRVGRWHLLVVDGIMYGPNPEVADGWIELGPPESVDPDSGTTPEEYLTAVAEDVRGETIRRITAEMIGLTTSQSEGGSTVYHGKVPAGALARERAAKEGEMIRVLPYGYVAHDNASDPASLIDIHITVGADGMIAEISAHWGGDSSWNYRLSFRDLGTTDPLEKPGDVELCPRCWLPDSDG